MPWTWIQSTGRMFDPSGSLLAQGYAGNGGGLNNPSWQNVARQGPLPRGWYTIGPLELSHGHLGTNVAALIPDKENVMFGRGGFFLHGRKSPLDMAASEGCIVIDFYPRMRVLQSPDRRLLVTNDSPTLQDGVTS